jgi:hypothetical protein
VNGSVDIDWGDGSEHTTLTGTNVNTYVSTSPHTYPAAGKYVIALTITGTATFLGKNNACGLLMKSSFNANESRYYINAIKSVNVGSGVTSIGQYAFQSCYGLRAITIPDSVTTIQNYTFQSCYSLSAVTIPDSVTSIWQYAFQSCYGLRAITIPDSVTSIGQYAFQNCSSLSAVTIPDSVTSIWQYAFQSCYSLSAVTIPVSVESIQNYTFTNCYGLGKIVFSSETTPPVISPLTFSNLPTDCKIYVPEGSLSAYTSAANYPSSSSYTYIEY